MANLEEKLTLRRRDFLKATGLTTAALIGADLLSSCTPKTPAAEIPEAPAAPTEDPNSQRASQIIKETVEKYPTIESLAGDPEELKRKMTMRWQCSGRSDRPGNGRPPRSARSRRK